MNINPYVYPGLKHQFLPKIYRIKKPINITLEDILEIVAENCGVTTEDILSKTRKTQITNARHIFCGIAKIHFNHKVTTLGKFLNRDHTTAVHAVQNYHNRCQYQNGYKDLVEDIVEKINNKFY